MNQKTKYIGMLAAIIPLVMMAIVPDYIGEADASNKHLIAIAKLNELNKAPEMPTAELSLAQMWEPKETKSFSVQVRTSNQFIGFVPVDNTPTYQVHYKVYLGCRSFIYWDESNKLI